MVSYLLNKASGVLHKLPASESCNTDQIGARERFEVHATESVVGYLTFPLRTRVRECKRCFRVD